MTRAPVASYYSEVLGRGEPLLLLHGGFCSLEHLRFLADALAADVEVHMYERPGHGRTPDRAGPYEYADAVPNALRYLDRFELGAVHVVGFSDGANIALMLAARQPQRVRSLVAISGNLDPTGFTHHTLPPATEPPAAAPPATAPPATEPPAAAPPLDAHPDAPDWQGTERQVYNALSPDGPDHAPVVIAKLLRLWASESHLSPHDLAQITAPTLILSGEHDTIRPDHSAAIASSIAGAQLRIVPGATHGLIEEHPDLVTAAVTSFVRSHRT